MKYEFDFTNVPVLEAEKMIKEMNSSINYISSGQRAKYKAKEELLKEFIQWGKDLSKELKEEDIAVNVHTNYSSWEHRIKGLPNVTLNIYYTEPYQTLFESVEDFHVKIIDYSGRADRTDNKFICKNKQEILDTIEVIKLQRLAAIIINRF